MHTEVGEVDDYQRQARLGEEVPLGDAETMVHRVLRSITDFGPLTDLLAPDEGDLPRGRARLLPRRAGRLPAWRAH